MNLEEFKLNLIGKFIAISSNEGFYRMSGQDEILTLICDINYSNNNSYDFDISSYDFTQNEKFITYVHYIDLTNLLEDKKIYFYTVRWNLL